MSDNEKTTIGGGNAKAETAAPITRSGTFLKFPSIVNIEQGNEDIVVAGFSFDRDGQGRATAPTGPAAIRAASSQLVWESQRWPWVYSLDDRLGIADGGDLVFHPDDPAGFVENAQAFAERILAAGKHMLSFANDNFFSLPLLRAYAEHYGPVALLYFDARNDSSAGGAKYQFGVAFSEAIMEGLIDIEHSIEVGIRTSLDTGNSPIEVLDAGWVDEHGLEDLLERIRARVGDKKAYCCIDVDGSLSSSLVSGDQTTAGIGVDYVLKIVRGMAGLNLVGMDLLDFGSSYAHDEKTSLAAAALAQEYLYVLAANKAAQLRRK